MAENVYTYKTQGHYAEATKKFRVHPWGDKVIFHKISEHLRVVPYISSTSAIRTAAFMIRRLGAVPYISSTSAIRIAAFMVRIPLAP